MGRFVDELTWSGWQYVSNFSHPLTGGEWSEDAGAGVIENFGWN